MPFASTPDVFLSETTDRHGKNLDNAEIKVGYIKGKQMLKGAALQNTLNGTASREPENSRYLSRGTSSGS